MNDTRKCPKCGEKHEGDSGYHEDYSSFCVFCDRNFIWDTWIKEDKEESSSDPLEKQVGGSHYKNYKIQPIEFIMKNKLDFCQGNVIKYVCRHEFKNGKEDLEKVKHYIDLLIKDKYEE